MFLHRLFSLSLIVVCSNLLTPLCAQVEVPDSILTKLTQMVADYQVKEDTPFIPGVQWAARKGMYDCKIKVNLCGKASFAALRENIAVEDDNLFTPMIVTNMLLEAHIYGGVSSITEQQLIDTIAFLKTGVEQNEPNKDILINFYPVKYLEEAGGYLHHAKNLPFFLNILKGMTSSAAVPLFGMLGFSDVMSKFQFMLADLVSDDEFYYKTPADADDTYNYVALGALVFSLRDRFPKAWDAFVDATPKITSTFEVLKKVAYRPFSTDPRVNTVDPRSYYGTRTFLDQAKKSGQDVVLANVWTLLTGEQYTQHKLGLGARYLSMEVDPTVSLNVLYGITSACLSGMVSPDLLDFDSDLAQIFHNSSKHITHVINNDFNGFYEISAVFYPHKFQLYFFVARTYALMAMYRNTRPLPAAVIEDVYHDLKNSLENQITTDVLRQSVQDLDGTVYFDDFLGNADLTHDGKPLNRAEDRIYVTATAANTLMHAWTVHDTKTGKSQWKSHVPNAVKRVVDGSIRWLLANTLEGQYKPWNAFFVAGTIGPEFEAPRYPANRYDSPDGVPYDDPSKLTTSDVFILGVQGYIQPDQYEKMLQQPQFGMPVPRTFGGFNSPHHAYFFWLSEALTYSNVLMALARYKNLDLQQTYDDPPGFCQKF